MGLLRRANEDVLLVCCCVSDGLMQCGVKKIIHSEPLWIGLISDLIRASSGHIHVEGAIW